MQLFIVIPLLFVLIVSIAGNDLEKYRLLREQCQRTPSNAQCVQLKSKFYELINKCKALTTKQKQTVCSEVKVKLCAVFPSECRSQTTKKSIRSTLRSKITTTTTTTATTKATTLSMLSNDEFVKVPIDPEELRRRGEYCIRNGKEKKCQQLLTNMKTQYSVCSIKKPTAPVKKPEEIDCHSFQTHLCKAFPKFPPCLKKTPK